MTTITKIETFRVPPRWLFLRVETSDGIVGWGEPVLEGRAATVEAAVHELAPQVMGSDPSRIEDTWQRLTRSGFYRHGPVLSSAVAGFDQALWDIGGKTHGVPVHDLLGGAVRDRVRTYSWVGGDDPAGVQEHIQARLDQGFTAVKMNASGALRHLDSPASVAEVIELARAAREALGPDGDFALDFHGRVSPAMAHRLLPLLEELVPMWVEEPVVPELAAQHLPALVARSSVPIATGERAFSRWDFKPLLEAGIAVAQPDLSHAGGISETRRIAAMAETYGVGLAPHCPLGPIALASCLQVDLAAPNTVIQESSLGIHYNEGWDLLDYLADTSPFDVRDGHIARLTGPGLGIEIDEAEVRKAAARGHEWTTPTWNHADGSLAEW